MHTNDSVEQGRSTCFASTWVYTRPRPRGIPGKVLGESWVPEDHCGEAHLEARANSIGEKIGIWEDRTRQRARRRAGGREGRRKGEREGGREGGREVKENIRF